MTQPLQIGPHAVQPPVVLAPMAGITNAPFRTLCREFSGGKGLFVSEMITTRALVERNEKTMQLDPLRRHREAALHPAVRR